MIGRIHSIQSLGTVDGPGVRFVAFLQGCPLRCKCCHNPDTWSTDGGTEYTAESLVEKVQRYRSYFGERGGITLSGGEPLMQAEFAAELLRRCHEEGVTTAIETTGFAPWEKLYAVAQHCDTVLFDVKHTDPEAHLRCTGVDNALILQNLRRLSREVPGCDIRLRTPLVPGYNDSEENMLQLGKLASELPNCSGVELLPYHNLGEGKRMQLGRSDAFSAETPSAEYMQQLRSIAAAFGKPVL